MAMAASTYVVANEESIQGQPSDVTEETVQQQIMANTSQLEAQQVRSDAEQANESWEDAREHLNTAMLMCLVNKCPAWHKESSSTQAEISQEVHKNTVA